MGFLINLLGIGGLLLIILAIVAFLGVIAVNGVAFLIAGIVALVLYFALTEAGPGYHRGRRY